MKRAVYIILGFCIAFGAIVQAQPPTSFQGPGQINHGENETSNMVRDYLALRLMRALDMEDDQSEKFWPQYYRYSRESMGLYFRRRELVDKINTELMNQTVEDNVLKEYAVQIKQIYEEEYKIKDDFLKKTEKILDDRRYAILVAFEENMATEFSNLRRRR